VIPVFGHSPEKRKENTDELFGELRSLASNDIKVAATRTTPMSLTHDEVDTTRVPGRPTISLVQYQLYTAEQDKKVRNELLLEEGMINQNETASSRDKASRKLEKKIRKKEPGGKLLSHFKAIGEAKKLFISPTRITIPILSLILLVLYYFVQTTQIVNDLKFDT
jgi:hypothetical protein